MQQLKANEISMVSGGCEQYCWGDFELGALMANTIGGAVAGAVSGPLGAVGGGAGAAIAYMFDVMWTD
jgi:outer membrane lipoprotein SlyB